MGAEFTATEATFIFKRVGVANKLGVWSDAEEQRLREGMQLHAQDWPAVAEFVDTRTLRQVKEKGQRLVKGREVDSTTRVESRG